MIPIVIFLRREEAAEANTFITQVAIAQAGGFCNNFRICHLFFSISSVEKPAPVWHWGSDKGSFLKQLRLVPQLVSCRDSNNKSSWSSATGEKQTFQLLQ
jgi:hypothetical protein